MTDALGILAHSRGDETHLLCRSPLPAAKEPIYGLVIEELERHGYKISAGTLYPLLRAMERDGWIKGRDEEDGARRRLYRITPQGRKALKEVRARLQELFKEVGNGPKKKPQ